MFLIRRKTPLLEKALTGLLAALALSACSPPGQKPPADSNAAPELAQLSVSPSASLGPFDGHINAIAFAPVTPVPWEGRLVIAPASGGLKVVDVEGKQDSHWQGSAFVALAVVPDYNLRGLKASLVLALDDTGGVHPFIIDDAQGQVIEAPVEGLPGEGVSALCALTGTRAGTAQFLIARADKTLALWRIADSGKAVLQASIATPGKMAVATGQCAADDDLLVATGLKGGLFTLAADDKVHMLAGVESAPAPLGVLRLKGRSLVLVSEPGAGVIHVYDGALKPLYTLRAPKALSTPGAAAPGAMAVSAHSFGGAGFSAGLLAVADDSSNRIALVVLDTVPDGLNKPAPEGAGGPE